MFDGVIDGFINLINNGFHGIINFFSQAWSYISQFFAFSWGLIEGLYYGFNSLITLLWDGLNNVFSLSFFSDNILNMQYLAGLLGYGNYSIFINLFVLGIFIVIVRFVYRLIPFFHSK